MFPSRNWVSRLTLATIALFPFGLSTGCLPPKKLPELTDAEKRVDQLTAENERLGRQAAERDGMIADLQQRLKDCMATGPNPLATLFRPTRLEILERTGGYNDDGKPGDDGVVVYLRPVDADGDAIKAPGEIQVVLYDLTTVGEPKEIAHYVVNEEGALKKAWYGGWMTNHYTVKCAWPPGVQPPASREVDIRATFTDAVSGDKLSASRQVKVEWVNPRN